MRASANSTGELPDGLIDDIYAAGLGDQEWDVALHKLRQHAQARMVTLLSYDDNTQLAAVNKAVGDSSAWTHNCLQQYAGEFYLYDPGAPVIGNWPVGKWYEDSVMLLPRQRARSIFHHEFMHPNGMNSISGLFVHRGSEGSVFLSFLGGPDSSGFTQAQRDEVSSLSIHISRALRMQVHMDRIKHKEALSEAVLDNLASPLFVLDGHRRLHFANAAAHRLIKVEPVMRFQQGRFAPDVCPDDAYWEEACKKGALILTLRSGASLPLSLVPLPQQSSLARGNSGSLILMTAFGIGSDEARTQRLQLIFGLTRTEAELAILISYRVMSPQECADCRGVSITTVRTHIQALFAKVGVSRLPQLITTILQLG